MRKSMRALALFVFAMFLCVACDTSSSDDMELELDPPETGNPDTTPPKENTEIRSPLITDTLPAPTGTGWYRFANDYYGMALTGTRLTYSETDFEELTYYWDGNSWEMFLGLRGTMTLVSGSEYNAKLTAIYMPNAAGVKDWYASGTPEFSDYLGYVWSQKGNETARVSFAVTGSSLTYKRDQNGDNDLLGAYDATNDFVSIASTTLKGHGRYPYGGWASLSVRGRATEASSSIELHSLLNDVVDNSSSSLVSGITGTMKGQNGVTVGPVAYDWDAADKDWGRTYTFPDPVEGGIMYLSAFTITYKNGATSTYTAADPWSKYAIAYKTDTGYEGSTTATEIRVGQDYMAPNDAGTGKNFAYVRTLPNKSSECTEEDGVDMEMYLYEEGDTVKWVAANDDWFSETDHTGLEYCGGFSTIKYPFDTTKNYYVKVVELNNERAAYSIILSNNLNIDTELVTAMSVDITLDSGEDTDDNPSTTTTTLVTGTRLDRIYDIDDPDWFIINP